MLSKFLDPKNDFAFRKIFGTKANKEILIHFLNDVISFTGQRPIVEVTFLPTVQDPEIAAQKSSIVDVLCRDDQGATYIVEMQVAREKGFEKRAQYYASKAYIAQAETGCEYHTLKEVIFLAIANFTMFKNKINYKSDHVILDFETHEHDLRDFSFTFIELPKFYKTARELESMADKWIYFFKHAAETSDEELAEIAGQDEIMKRAYHELDRYYWTQEERHLYDQAEKHKNAYLASMAQKFDEGKAQGIAEGKAQGVAEGRAQGVAEGKAQGVAEGKAQGVAEGKEAVALKMIEQGCEDGLIMAVTSVTIERLSALRGNGAGRA